MLVRGMVVSLLLLFLPATAHALELVSGKVTVVEPTYFPNSIQFQMDVGSASCPAGRWLKWTNSNTENVKGIYAALMAALISQKSVSFYVNDGDTSCTGAFLHLIAN